MKKTLLVATVIMMSAFQAQAVVVHDYIAIRGTYAGMEHKSKEKYSGSTERPVYNWNDNVGGGSVAYGLKAGYLRAEVEGNINSATETTRNFLTETGEIDSTTVGKIKTSSVFFNTYLELPVDFPVRPYISAGAGMSHVKAQFKNSSPVYTGKTKLIKNRFAWQVGAGIATEITPEWAVDIGYRYINYGRITKETFEPEEGGAVDHSTLSVSSQSHNVYLGLRYTF